MIFWTCLTPSFLVPRQQKQQKCSFKYSLFKSTQIRLRIFIFILSDRDIFNEKPSREEIVAATQVSRLFTLFPFMYI